MTQPAPSVSAPVIEMHGVDLSSYQDPADVVATGIDWSVQPGDYWVVAGLQGSGKNDFLMMTGGVTAPAAGTYRLFGVEMPVFDEQRLPARLRLGLVFAGGQLLNHLTIRENISLPLRYHRNLSHAQADAEVNAWLEAMELQPWADITPGAVGRHWRQRAGLARALMLGPEVLLVDNPLSGLDLRHAYWWLGFLDQLSKGHPLLGSRPMSLIVTTADLRPWKNRTRQFAVLRNRRFAVLGSWAQLEAASQDLLQELLPVDPA